MLDMLPSVNPWICTDVSVHNQRLTQSIHDEQPTIVLLLVWFSLVDKFLSFLQPVESELLYFVFQQLEYTSFLYLPAESHDIIPESNATISSVYFSTS